MKRVVIVGNGPLERGASEAIDSADAVIRFNRPSYTPEFAGSRTDVLFLVNSGKSMQAWLSDPAFKETKYFRKARQIILPYDPAVIRKYHPKPNPLSWLKGRRADWTDAARRQFTAAGKDVTVLPARFYEDCCEALMIPEANRKQVFPSTGFIGIRYGLAHFPSRDWEIAVVGFTWQGWKRHDWQAEKAWVAQRVRTL